MINHVLVSVVIPIYKTEKYLERCVNSILSQTYKNLEIILIDDGSPDNCPVICDKIAETDSRVKVMHKVNQGLGMARNSGIEIATGKYICFFDSDDFIEKNAIELLVAAAEQYNAEIVCFGLNQLNSKLRCTKTVRAEKEIVFCGQDRITNDFIPSMIHSCKGDKEVIGLWMNMCSAMFSLDYIKRSGWKCASERKIISEDIFSLLMMYREVKCAVVIDKVLYNYCDNAMSLSKSFRLDRFEQLNDFYGKVLQLSHKLSYGKSIYGRLCYPYLDFYIAALKQLNLSKLSKREKHDLYMSAVTDRVFRDALDAADIEEYSGLKKQFIRILKTKRFVLGYIMLMLANKRRRMKEM